MARIRTFKPEFWSDSKTGTLSDRATKLFLAMFNFADDMGVLPYDLDEMRAKIFPYAADVNTETIDKIISEELIKKGLLVEFIYENSAFLQIFNFVKHQVINRPSKPLIENLSTDDIMDYITDGRTLTADSLITHHGKGKERKGKERSNSVISDNFVKWWNENIKHMKNLNRIQNERKTLFLNRQKKFGLDKIKEACLIGDMYVSKNPEHFKWLRGLDWILLFRNNEYHIDKLIERRYDCFLPKAAPQTSTTPAPPPVKDEDVTPEDKLEADINREYPEAWAALPDKTQREITAKAKPRCTLKMGQMGYIGQLSIIQRRIWADEYR